MNKILVVAKNPETYFIKRLIAEVGEPAVQLFNPWRDPAPVGFSKILFRSFGVYHSDKDLDFVRSSLTPTLNSLESLQLFRSKSSQYQFFNSRNHPTLPWWHLKDWEDEGRKLYLVKPDLGQGGWGIQVMNADALSGWREEKFAQEDLSWIVQPYVRAPEYRVFFMGDERITLRRVPDENLKAANFAQDGDATVVSMPFHVSLPVEKLIFESQAYYGAIDLLDTPNGVVFLEVNVVPGIEQLEKITGINIIKGLLTANYFCQIS